MNRSGSLGSEKFGTARSPRGSASTPRRSAGAGASIPRFPLLHTTLLLSVALFGCEQLTRTTPDEVPLARVYNRYLYPSELEGLVPAGSHPEDSALTVRAYVDRWTRNAAMMYEAEQNLPENLDINKLVRDYRASLIRHNYEKRLIDAKLDSTISQEELTAFYEQNRNGYLLDTDIARVLFLKIPRNAPRLGEVRNWWNADRNGEAWQQLQLYAGQFAPAYSLQDSTWHRAADLARLLPLDADRLDRRREFTQTDDDFVYFFRLLETKRRREIAPLSFIEEQARKFILHQRKMKLLDEMNRTVYERELTAKNIEVY